MSWLNRALGYPDPDPSGRNRGLFRKIGGQAAQAFFGEQNANKAASIIEGWAQRIVPRFGEYHPDIGRISLLMALFQVILQNEGVALQLAESAKGVLEPLGEDDYDYRAAIDLVNRLDAKRNGTFRQSRDNPLIDPATPIGRFLNDLKP